MGNLKGNLFTQEYIMAKIKMLSARTVNSLTNGFHSDGANLYLRVRDNSRVWFFRYKKSDKQISIGLGAIHTRSLSQAREIATLMRNAIANGKNPANELKNKFDATAMTFKAYALALIEAKRPSWRNIKHAQQWNNTLEQYAYPIIGNKLPAEITLSDIKNILAPIWTTKTETASRVRMRIEAVLDYAAVHDNSDRRNPARWKGNLDKLLPAPHKIRKRVHFAAAPYNDVPRIMSILRKKNSLSAYCLRFIILTAARSGEARGAMWNEIDLETKTWSIPAIRMKADRDHIVPLCDEAVNILKTMQRWNVNSAHRVFQSERGGLLSDVAINKTLHAIVSNVTVHGFRSSFRVWGAETTSISSTVLELALAHVNKNRVEAAYQRSDLFNQRRQLMKFWSQYCNTDD
jgi:integrase